MMAHESEPCVDPFPKDLALAEVHLHSTYIRGYWNISLLSFQGS